MSKVKISITLSDALFTQVRRLSPNVSQFVEAAVAERLGRERRRLALEVAQGAWADEGRGAFAEIPAEVRTTRRGWERTGE